MDYMNLYIDIINKYPPLVNQKQMAEICKMGVRTIRALIKNSKIPCQNRTDGFNSWYEIKLTDVLKFLYEKECRQDIKSSYMVKLRRFYKEHLTEYPDVVTVKEITQITGYVDTTVVNWVNRGLLQAYKGKTYRIPKVYLIDFLCGVYYRQIKRKTIIQNETMQIFLNTNKFKK